MSTDDVQDTQDTQDTIRRQLRTIVRLRLALYRYAIPSLVYAQRITGSDPAFSTALRGIDRLSDPTEPERCVLCGQPALCVSGNLSDSLVCSDCFKIVNGRSDA